MARVYCEDCEWEASREDPIMALAVGDGHENDNESHTVVTTLGDMLK